MNSEQPCIAQYCENPIDIIRSYANPPGHPFSLHLWKCIQANDPVAYSHVYYTPDSNKYIQVVPDFQFQVKAKNDVHVCVRIHSVDYEFVLGGWNNTKSVLRHGRHGIELQQHEGKILSSHMFHTFQIEVGESHLSLLHKDRKGVETLFSTPFVHSTESSDTHTMYIKSCFGSDAFWKWSTPESVHILFYKNKYENYDSFYKNYSTIHVLK
jgi:hypothetical protein